MTTIQIKKAGQDPQIINVPEGAKIIIEDGVTIVEPEFKDGDIVYWENDMRANCVSIFKKWHSISSCLFNYYFLTSIDMSFFRYNGSADCSLDYTRCMRIATESEKQLLIDVLAKDGNQWNPSAKQIEELKYIPKDGDCVEFDTNENNDKKGYFVAKIINGEVYEYGDWLPIGHAKVSPKSDLFYDTETFSFRKITPEELQSKFNELGYEYNFKTHTAEKLRWKPKYHELYYIPDVCDGELYSEIFNEGRCFDEICIERNIAFKTPEEAIECAKKMLSCL